MRSGRFVAYEHDRLEVGRRYPEDGARFEEHHFEALARYRDRTETPAFTLGHRSIRLCEHVGFLRVGPVSLEVYPKLGRTGPDRDWRGLLFHMLRVVTGLRIAPQDNAPLAPRAGELFDVLLNRFLEATEAILREGPVRAYREIEENGTAFRGRLLGAAHARENHSHQERLYVAYEVHDADNLPNRILHRALDRLIRTESSLDLVRRAEAALSAFPEVSTRPIRDADWANLRFDRRTERYREATTLARMILRDERPDLRWGDREVLAMTFDMNALFEAYVERALRARPGLRVHAQRPGRFWKPEAGPVSWAKPDLLVYTPDDPRPIVLDTKWKVPKQGRPADEDLRQVYAYVHTFGGRSGALVYPRASSAQVDVEGEFLAGGHPGRLLYVDLFPGGAPDVGRFRAELASALRVETLGAA